ncbi:unnamed protein product [Protopolystoma xenopodis]|uniref:Uncharacterized protein n=1 Tax=Protopolystoma xenopodis TaxID=117903 RepID=A0A448WXH2_9PLAT|nr:unnamed protein product [Protopolystoma xenopodis]
MSGNAANDVYDTERRRINNDRNCPGNLTRFRKREKPNCRRLARINHCGHAVCTFKGCTSFSPSITCTPTSRLILSFSFRSKALGPHSCRHLPVTLARASDLFAQTVNRVRDAGVVASFHLFGYKASVYRPTVIRLLVIGEAVPGLVEQSG